VKRFRESAGGAAGSTTFDAFFRTTSTGFPQRRSRAPRSVERFALAVLLVFLGEASTTVQDDACC